MQYQNGILLIVGIVIISSLCGCYEEYTNIKHGSTPNFNNDKAECYNDGNNNKESYNIIKSQNIFLDKDVSKNYPIMNKFPKRYYKISDEMYPDVIKKDLNTLEYILNTIKLPRYKKNYYDCSEVSCQLEWILEGYGFKTYIATNSNHAWVLVQLDDGKMVAVESTLLCENNYCPSQAIRYEDYPYYHPKHYVDTPDKLLIPYNNKRMLITQLDWWNHPKNIEIKKKLYNLN